jgi:hypothetical protein
MKINDREKPEHETPKFMHKDIYLKRKESERLVRQYSVRVFVCLFHSFNLRIEKA